MTKVNRDQLPCKTCIVFAKCKFKPLTKIYECRDFRNYLAAYTRRSHTYSRTRLRKVSKYYNRKFKIKDLNERRLESFVSDMADLLNTIFKEKK